MTATAKLLQMGAAGAAGEALYVEDVFSTYLYTGNSSSRSITNGVDLAGEGGLVWLKERGAVGDHGFFDTVRGTTDVIYSNLTNAESSLANSLTAFNADGFSLGTDSTYNFSNSTYASWTFRKAKKFFDVVTYTGTGSPRTVSHNLGSAPGCIIVKRYDSTGSWAVWHRSGTQTNGKFAAFLNTSGKYEDQAENLWGSETVAPDMNASTFGVGTAGSVNSNGFTYVAYLFAHDAGGFGEAGDQNVITCGSYTGNGSTTGPTVTLGYEPQWLMIKSSSTTSSWQIIDNMRGMVVGGNEARLLANSSSAELSNDYLSPTATGFQLVSTSSEVNGNGQTYIYIAIRRGPMKTPEAGTEVFSPLKGASTTPGFITGWPVDTLILGYSPGFSGYPVWGARLTGDQVLTSSSTAAQTTNSYYTWDYSNGSLNLAVGSDYIGWNFRRAPGFFDVVCYTGTGTTLNLSHNLGVTPELKIIKRRNSTANWVVGGTVITGVGGVDGNLFLDLNNANSGSSPYWDAADTSTTFSTRAGNGASNLSGGTYVAYLFATVAGVSKVGSYTGTGTTLQVNCGFSSGSRFVLIKRTDSTGDWYVWDSARGIVAGNDPYLLLNSTAAEVTGTDYVDTYSAGFEISSTAPAAINANGGTFIFLAIA